MTTGIYVGVLEMEESESKNKKMKVTAPRAPVRKYSEHRESSNKESHESAFSK